MSSATELVFVLREGRDACQDGDAREECFFSGVDSDSFHQEIDDYAILDPGTYYLFVTSEGPRSVYQLDLEFIAAKGEEGDSCASPTRIHPGEQPFSASFRRTVVGATDASSTTCFGAEGGDGNADHVYAFTLSQRTAMQAVASPLNGDNVVLYLREGTESCTDDGSTIRCDVSYDSNPLQFNAVLDGGKDYYLFVDYVLDFPDFDGETEKLYSLALDFSPMPVSGGDGNTCTSPFVLEAKSQRVFGDLTNATATMTSECAFEPVGDSSEQVYSFEIIEGAGSQLFRATAFTPYAGFNEISLYLRAEEEGCNSETQPLLCDKTAEFTDGFSDPSIGAVLQPGKYLLFVDSQFVAMETTNFYEIDLGFSPAEERDSCGAE